MLLIAGIILLAYVIPYTVLSQVTAWYGSFLFWCLIGLAAIIVNVFITRDWGK
jgi:hypothetical protein